MAIDFQYPIHADVPSFELIPEFETVYDVELVTEFIPFDKFDNDELELIAVVSPDFFETIVDDFEERPIIIEENVFDDNIDVLIAMPDFFEVYHDDIIEPVKAWEVDEYHNENPELWENLPLQALSYAAQYFNFGKPVFPGKLVIPNQYIFNGYPSAGDFVIIANRIYYVPVYFPYTMHIVELGCYFTIQDPIGQAFIGIYNSERGVVKDLIYYNQLSTNTLAYRGVPADLWVTEGCYFLAFVTNSLGVAVLLRSILSEPVFGTILPGQNIINSYAYEDGTFALPDSAGSNLTLVGSSNGQAPRLHARIGP